MQDNAEGDVVYIDHLFTYKSDITKEKAIEIFHNLIELLREKHPQIKELFWKRWNWKKSKICIYHKKIK